MTRPVPSHEEGLTTTQLILLLRSFDKLKSVTVVLAWDGKSWKVKFSKTFRERCGNALQLINSAFLKRLDSLTVSLSPLTHLRRLKNIPMKQVSFASELLRTATAIIVATFLLIA